MWSIRVLVPQTRYGWEDIGGRWAFRKKNTEQYKAKLVAKRFAQKEGINYSEIFSPVLN